MRGSAVTDRLPAVAGIVALACATLLLRRRFAIAVVTGSSMSPTHEDGDRVLVRRVRRFRRFRRFRTGDVVVARHPDARPADAATSWLVKRIAGLPGDPVPDEVARAVAGAERVAAGMVVLIGDHPGSVDSRAWGFVPLSHVEGVVVARLRGSG